MVALPEAPNVSLSGYAVIVLNRKVINDGLAKIGEHLQVAEDVEILVVGGAAGILTGELPAAWTTADVDVVHFHPAKDRDAVLAAAGVATRELLLPPSWLSEDVGLYEWTLPDGWQSRRIKIGLYGRLTVYAVSRVDLIAMKFLAHRERDLEHLAQMKVTADELSFVRRYLEALDKGHPDQRSRIEMARAYVDLWKTEP